jgi:hypothetical protein
MKNKALKNLLVDFIPERFTFSGIEPERNKSGISNIRFSVYLPERKFEIKCSINSRFLWLGSIPEIRILSYDYKKVKETFDKLKIDYERGVL